MNFPYHHVPDGSVAVPHHFIWALILAVIPLAIIWDNQPDREPWVAVTAIIIALISFVSVWPTHHVLGAALAVVMTGIAIGALILRIVWFRGEWPVLPLVIALLFVLIASDDVLQHAFGLETPLDWLWKHHLRPRLPSH